MKKQYGWPVSIEDAANLTLIHHRAIREGESVYFCKSDSNGFLYVFDTTALHGYAIGHEDLIRLAKDNLWLKRAGPEYGKLIDERTLFLRKEVGTINDGEKAYFMSIAPRGEPVIESHQTGKQFILEWHDILKIAVEAGVDDVDTAEESGV